MQGQGKGLSNMLMNFDCENERFESEQSVSTKFNFHKATFSLTYISLDSTSRWASKHFMNVLMLMLQWCGLNIDSTCNNGSFFLGIVRTMGHTAVIFGNPGFIANFTNPQSTFIYGTFKADHGSTKF